MLIADSSSIMFIDWVFVMGRGLMSMLYTLIWGKMSFIFFEPRGKCPPLSISRGDRCPHIPFLIGGQMSEGGKC